MTADNILGRIAKLRAMASQSVSENEAQIAMAKLATLMAEHNVTESDLGRYTSRKDFTEDSWGFMGESNWLFCHGAVQELFGVKFWKTTEQDDILGAITRLHCYGMPADVAAALAMMEICWNATMGEAGKAIKAKTLKRRDSGSFYAGMGSRLADRVREVQGKAPGQHLMVSRKAEVEAAFAEVHGGLRKAVAKAFNQGAYTAGHAAGANVRLGFHREVGEQRKIGHG